LSVTASHREGLLEELLAIFAARKLVVTDISSNVDMVNNELYYQLVITQQQKRIGHELTTEISQLEGIRKIHYH
jgi:ACT domain-containing protein